MPSQEPIVETKVETTQPKDLETLVREQKLRAKMGPNDTLVPGKVSGYMIIRGDKEHSLGPGFSVCSYTHDWDPGFYKMTYEEKLADRER